MSLSALEQSLSQGFRPAYLLAGEARPLRDAALARLIEVLKPEYGLASLNLTQVRAAEVGPEVMAGARTLPMMGRRRVLAITGFEEAKDALFEAIETYLSEPPQTSTLILSGDKFPKVEKGGKNWSLRIKNAFKKQGVILDFDPSTVSPHRYAIDVAAKLGKTLGHRDAERLVAVVGVELGALGNEVEKLSLYVGDAAAITGADVDRCCALAAEPVVWDLTQGLATRNGDLAVSALHRLLEDGEAPHRLLALVAWQLRSVLVAAEMFRDGAPDDAVARATKLRLEPLRRIKAEAPRTAAHTPAILRGLARLNGAMNGHRAGDRLIFESWVAQSVVQGP